MDSPTPPATQPPATLRLPLKDWPHAPVHRMSEHGVYIVTAGTFNKEHLFDSDQKLDLMERFVLSYAKQYSWHLEAWAVFANHYHFVARGNQGSTKLGQFLQQLHYDSAAELNRYDGKAGRHVWYNFWDTKLTHQYSYLARLNYVHQNAVKHGLVPVANQYRWCSARWFERVASPAQVKTIYSFKIDKVNVHDDF
jgi:putative transposase